jgi:hypothetical protein
MILTALMPDQSTVGVDVPDGQLIYDGRSFMWPLDAQWVALYTVPTEAESADYKDVVLALATNQYIRAKVMHPPPTSTLDPTISPKVQPDPANGECVCGITCAGTNIRFAKVFILED